MTTQRKIGGVIVLVIAAVAVLSLVWTPFDPLQADVHNRLQGSSAAHWMGTDQFGRDITSRVMDGARLTLTVAIGAVGLSALVGVPLGIWAGWEVGPLPEQVRMLQASQPFLATSPHLALWPGLAIAVTVLGFNLLGGTDDRR